MRRSDSIFINTVFILAAKIIDVFAAAAVAILVARMLGVAGSGRFWFVVAYVSVFGVIVNIGLDHIIIRESARRREELPQILGASIKLKTFLLIILAPLLFGGLFVLNLDSELQYAIILLFIAQNFLRELLTVISQAVFLGLEKLKYRTVTTLAFQLIRVAGITIVLILGGGLVPLFASVIFADLIQGVWTIKLVHKHFAKPDFSVSTKEVWALFREALPIGLAFGLTTAFLWLDTLLLKTMRGDYENGLFANSYRIISTLILVVIPMIWVLLPHLTRTFHQSIESLKKEGEFYLKCIAVVMIPLSVIIGFYATDLIIFLFGADFRPAGLALAIVAPTLALRSIWYLFDLSLTAAQKQKLVAVGAGTAFLSKLLLEIWLIPKMGFTGAAWGTLWADCLAFIVIFMLIRRYVVKYNPLIFLLKPGLAGILVLLLLFWIRLNPILGIPLTIVVYSLLVLVFGTFNRDERESIISLITRKIGGILQKQSNL